jgi:serine/threonine-protein kinase
MTSGPEKTELPAGTRVAGRFVIEQFVRRGPLASVYIARAESANTARFIVRLVHTRSTGTDAVAVVGRELQRVAMLRQRAVPALTAVGGDAAGLVVITERPEGPSLRETLAKGSRLRPGDVGRLIMEVATVLDAMHVASPPIVHRALCPENISMTDRMLRVWVEECGFAQALTTSGILDARAHAVARPYLSPDELAGRLSARGDLFVLASLAWECLTGTPAYQGPSDAAVDSAIVRGPRPTLRGVRDDISPDVDATFTRAWTGDGGAFSSAGAFARELARALSANPTTSRAVPAARATTPGTGGAAPVEVSKDKSTTPMLAATPVTPATPATPVTPMSLRHNNPNKATLLGIGDMKAPPARAPVNGAATNGASAQAPNGASSKLAATLGPPTSPKANVSEALTTAERIARERSERGVTMKVEVPRIHPPGTEPVEPARARSSSHDIANSGRDSAISGVPRAPLGAPPLPGARGTPAPTAPASTPPAPPAPLPATATNGSAAPVLGANGAGTIEEAETWEVVDAPITPFTDDSGRFSSPGTVQTVDRSPTSTNPPANSPVIDFTETDDFPAVVAPAPAPTPVFAEAPAMPVAAPPMPMSANASGLMNSGENSVPQLAVPVIPQAPSVPEPLMPMMPNAPPANGWAGPPPLPTMSRDETMRFPTETLETPRAGRKRLFVLLGVGAVVAATVAVAGFWFVSQQDQPVAQNPPPRTRPNLRRPRLVATADAGAAAPTNTTASADAGAAPIARTQTDAGATTTATHTADASTTVAANTTDNSTDNTPPEQASTHEGRLPRRPHREDVDAVEQRLKPAVLACVSGTPRRRHMRVGVVYEGSTGRAVEIHISSAFASAPVGPCVETAIRANPLPRFRNEDWETDYVFDLDERESAE